MPSDAIECDLNLSDGESATVYELFPPAWGQGTNNSQGPHDYVRCGGENWIAWHNNENASDLAAIWVYRVTDAGTLVARYDVDVAVAAEGAQQIDAVALASDDTTVWLAAVAREPQANPYGGLDGSPTWEPWHLRVWAFDGGAFADIGHIDAEANSHGGAPFDATTTGDTRGPLVCAAAAEPGVLHLLWQEWGLEGASLYDGIAMRNRLNYSRWSPAALLGETDVYLRRVPYSGGWPGWGTDQVIPNSVALANEDGNAVIFINYAEFTFDAYNFQPQAVVHMMDASSWTELQQVTLPDRYRGGTMLAAIGVDGSDYLLAIGVAAGYFDLVSYLYEVPMNGSGAITFWGGDAVTATLGYRHVGAITVDAGGPWLVGGPGVSNLTNPFILRYGCQDYNGYQEIGWHAYPPGDRDWFTSTSNFQRLLPQAPRAYEVGDGIFWAGWVEDPDPNAFFHAVLYRSQILRDYECRPAPRIHVWRTA